MNKEFAELLVSSWNGSDSYFLCDGGVYSEDCVQEAQEYLDNLNN